MHHAARYLVVGALAAGSMAAAAESPHSFSANVALTSEYMYRGLSQTDDTIALQGGFDYGHASGFYAGLWGSNVRFRENFGGAGNGNACSPNCDEAVIEVDVYAGFANELSSGLGYDVGVLYYAYPGADSSLDYDFWEVYGGLSYSFKGMPMEPTAGIKLSYSPEFFGDVDEALYWDASLDFALPQGFGLGLHVGYSDFDNENLAGRDYWDWKVGVSKDVAGFTLDLSYTDTDFGGDPDGADEAVIFTVSRSF